MGIDADFSLKALEEIMNAVPEILKEEIIRALAILGEECVIRIRDRSGEESWFDQTHNLRGSIGYAIYNHSQIMIESAFNQVNSGKDGPVKGRQMVKELASKYAQTFALVIVAGMEYADYVEAMKGKDVLASTELWVRSENMLDKRLEGAKNRASLRIEKLQKQLGL